MTDWGLGAREASPCDSHEQYLSGKHDDTRKLTASRRRRRQRQIDQPEPHSQRNSICLKFQFFQDNQSDTTRKTPKPAVLPFNPTNPPTVLFCQAIVSEFPIQFPNTTLLETVEPRMTPTRGVNSTPLP